MNIRKIAEIAGTSHTTVSRALNNSPLVAEATRERILEIAARLGYQINAGARSLSTGVRNTVGLLYSFHRTRQLDSYYTAQLLHFIAASLTERGFDTMIEGFDKDAEDVATITRIVRQKKVDGLLLIGYDVNEQLAHEITAVTDRCVFINPAHQPWVEHYPPVLIDHYRGGRLAAAALIARGCTRLATISEDDPQFRVRVSGFIAECADHGHGASCEEDDRFILPGGSYQDAYESASERIEELRTHDGLFVGSDVTAVGVMNALLDHGLRVPEDIAVVGYDDIEWAAYVRPALTTVHQPKQEVAEAAATEIVERVVGERSGRFSTTFEPRLVTRMSA